MIDSDEWAAEFRTFETSDPRFESDNLRQITVQSAALGQRADISVHVPDAARNCTDAPLVILLHGVYGSHWAWCRKGGAHVTAERLIAAREIPPLILAMPSDGLWGHGSGYLPHRFQNFERWIVSEVPAAVRRACPAVTTASPLFIAGLSMGGFGALRLGAKFPHRFRACSGHSSITDFAQFAPFVGNDLSRYEVSGEDTSVFEALRRNRDRLPAFRFDCGKDDSLLSANRALHAALEEAGIAHRYEEFPGGHEWFYWEKHLRDSLRFFAEKLG